MVWYFTGVALLLTIFFWGIGLTFLVLPRRWWRFWSVFCPYFGLALQSALVWGVAHVAVALRGTDRYAGWALLLPAGLSLGAVWRVGGWRPLGRLLGEGIVRPWGLWLATAVTFAVVVYPFTRPPGTLTCVAMSSCDAADYAVGARVFKEFSADDRTGFLGLTEVVQIGSVTNFYDFWLRLNHFTPSALIALNGSLLGVPPHELTSLLGVVLLALNLPAVWWLARTVFRLQGWGATLVALLYGLNPILLYAVYQTALAQLLAAPAVALLFWLGLRAWRGPGTWRHYACLGGLLLMIHWLIFGSYNFVVVFCYAPLLAYVGARMVVGGRWREGWRWLAWVGSGLLVSLPLFPGRVISIPERLGLFQATSFGWRIPPLDYAGWFGLVDGEKLAPTAHWSARALAAGLLGLLAWAAVDLWHRGGREGRRALGFAAACVGSTAVGYGLLLWQAERAGDNSSYNAYKLFCVFYPATLVSLCLFLRPTTRRAAPSFPVNVAGGTGSNEVVTAKPRLLVGIALCLALLGMIHARHAPFAGAIRKSWLTVDPSLRALAQVEARPQVGSVNVLLESLWPRLWANYFLLRKPQFFIQRTYEGRRVTAPRGDWDLRDTSLVIRPPGPPDPVDPGQLYYLLDCRSPEYIGLNFLRGWFAPERLKVERWMWAGENPVLEVNNMHPYPVRVQMHLAARSLRPRTLRVVTGADGIPPWTGQIGTKLTHHDNIPLHLPPGHSQLVFETPEPGDHPGPNDPRRLTVAFYRLEVDLPVHPPLNPADGSPARLSSWPSPSPSSSSASSSSTTADVGTGPAVLAPRSNR